MQYTETTAPPAGPAHDLTREEMLTFAEAARLFPPSRRGRPVNISTVWRWCKKGVRVPGVGKVRLESIRVAGRTLTSREAISRFVAAQTPAAEQTAAPTWPRTAGQRRRASERVARELDRIGI